jgi:hypothetical protein
MDGYRDIERFTAHQSKVAFVEKVENKERYILKIYPNHYCLVSDMEHIRSYEGKIRVPKIIKASDREMLMENITGRTLGQELIDGPMFKINMIAGYFLKWIKDFHEATEGAIIEKISFHSYIVKSTNIYAFDFVDVEEKGDIDDMIAEVIAEILLDEKISDVRKSMFVREFMRVNETPILKYKEKCIARLQNYIKEYGIDETAEGLFRKVG